MINLKHIAFFKGNTVPTWQKASDFARGFAAARSDEQVLEFTVVWADGETYDGAINLTYAQNGYDIAAHIRSQAETYTGKAKPAHVPEDVYKAGLAKVPKVTRAKLLKLLADYDLTGTPTPKDDPPQEAVMDKIAFRFKNIVPGVGRLPNDAAPDFSCGGMFPPAPKNVDDYVDPLFGAEVVWGLNTPGRA